MYVCMAALTNGNPCGVPNMNGDDHCPNCGAEYFEYPVTSMDNPRAGRARAILDMENAGITTEYYS
jgi:hypothetical protein